MLCPGAGPDRGAVAADAAGTRLRVGLPVGAWGGGGVSVTGGAGAGPGAVGGGRAGAGPGAGGEGGVVRRCDGVDDGQAEAVAVRVACSAGGEPLEGLEEPLDLTVGYRGPGVSHEQGGAAGFEGGHDLDLAAGGVVPDGVIGQVGPPTPRPAGGRAALGRGRGRGEGCE